MVINIKVVPQREEVRLLSEARKAHEQKQQQLEEMTLKLQATVNSSNRSVPCKTLVLLSYDLCFNLFCFEDVNPILPRDMSIETNRMVQNFVDPVSNKI